jgi:type II secretory pathway component PulF
MLVDGVAEVGSREGLLEQLRHRNLYPIEIREVHTAGTRRGGRLGRRAAVTRWARNVAALLSAGTPVERALAITADQAGHDGLATALAAVRTAVQGGEDLASALSRHPALFPSVVPAMVRAGEASGALGTVFEQIADFLEETEELRAQVGAALLYPALMAVVASLGVAVLLLFVVPRFAGILEDVGGSLPLTTQALIWVGNAAARFWWLFLLAAVVAGLWVTSALRREDTRRRWDARRLRLPLIGDLERKLVTARFTKTLGLLLQNGTTLLPAMEIARASVTNRAVATALQRAGRAVSEGASLTDATRDALPPLASQMIAVGEESGRLADMCLRVARTFEGEVRRSLKTAVTLIEPVLIVLFGALVGFVALAMLQAIYSINTTAF